MSINDKYLLNHILKECNYIIDHTPRSFEEFIKDETLTRAFVRSLEIIGEATKKISSKARSSEGIDWSRMAGMRDRLIHNYMGSTI